jgi:hypothetical protein
MPRNSVTFDGRVQHAQYIFALMTSKCKGKLFLSNSSAGETQSKDCSPELSSLKGIIVGFNKLMTMKNYVFLRRYKSM